MLINICPQTSCKMNPYLLKNCLWVLSDLWSQAILTNQCPEFHVPDYHCLGIYTKGSKIRNVNYSQGCNQREATWKPFMSLLFKVFNLEVPQIKLQLETETERHQKTQISFWEVRTHEMNENPNLK